MSVVYRRDPERGFRVWTLREVYTGENIDTTDTLYVPNVGDIVFDGFDLFYRVDAVDEVTAIPTLVPFNPAARFENEIKDPDNLHEGLKLYQPHIATRIFIDKLTQPFTLSIDSRYRVYGSEATQMKLYLGTDTSPEGTVISQTIDSRGAVISETVDLVPLFQDNATLKRPARCHTSHDLHDGEIVTAIIYNAAGRACGEHSFIVRNANMIAGPTASNVYVEDVELISHLISDHDPLLIENQLNVPFNTSMLTCRVHYSDGSHQDHAIDGVRVKLHGLSNFNTSLLGPTTHVVLSYYPSAQEQSINLSGTPTPSISKTYKLANVPTTDNFAFKLYVIPYWTGNQYELRVRLTDVEYTLNLDVTDKVEIKQSNGWDFNGLAFGITQTLNLTVALDDVVPGAYPGHVHVQQVSLTLNQPFATNVDNWVIDYLGDGYTQFGTGVYAVASSLDDKPFNISCNQVVVYDWLSLLYSSLDPIYDSTLLESAPTPTHFRLENGGENGDWEIGTYSVEDWNQTFRLGVDRDWDRAWPLNIVWLVIANGREKVVGITPLSIENDV